MFLSIVIFNKFLSGKVAWHVLGFSFLKNLNAEQL